MSSSSRELWSIVGEGQRRAVLINSFLEVFTVSTNMSSVMIALPAILRGIGLNANTAVGFVIMMWLMFAFPLMMTVAVALLGRLSDMYGRGRVFTYGDIIFTVASLAMGLIWSRGVYAGIQLVALRFLQGLGGSMMFVNSPALIMDVYPPERRGVAQGLVGGRGYHREYPWDIDRGLHGHDILALGVPLQRAHRSR